MAEFDEEQAALFDTLRAWRLSTSRAEGVPAFRVVGDKVLCELVLARPTTLAGVAAVRGIGKVKLAKYGEQILAALCSFSADTAEPDSLR